MTITSGLISISGLRVYAYHGVLPQERTVGGEYAVSLTVSADISRAAETDDISDTLNYAGLADVIVGEMAVPSSLLEHVAGRIGRSVIARYPEVRWADVTVSKENPPLGVACSGASVTLHIVNDA